MEAYASNASTAVNRIVLWRTRSVGRSWMKEGTASPLRQPGLAKAFDVNIK